MNLDYGEEQIKATIATAAHLAVPVTTITVSPSPVTLTVGANQTFTANGYDLYGSLFPITPTWTTNGGTIDATGFFAAQTAPATGRLVTATLGSVSGTALVNIVPCISPTITTLTSDSPVRQGQTMHLIATVTGDAPITFTWNFGDNTPWVAGVGLTNISHVYSAIGSLTVTLAVTNSCGSSSRALAVRVNAPPGEPDHITLVAVPARQPVSNTSTLTATVYDASNALLAGQVVTFTTGGPLGSGALIPLTATTNVQGQASAVISSTLTGVKRITVTAYNAAVASTSVTFYSDPYRVYLPLVMRDYAPPPLTRTANLLALMVGDTPTSTATALDGWGAPIAHLMVAWSISGPLGSGARCGDDLPRRLGR